MEKQQLTPSVLLENAMSLEHHEKVTSLMLSKEVFDLKDPEKKQQLLAALEFLKGEFVTVKGFLKSFSYIPESTLRWQIHRAKALGLSSAFIRPFGQRKILISVGEYFRVMLEKHEQAVGGDEA